MGSVKSVTESEPIDCLFRTEVQGAGDTETAQCLLLAQILNTPPEQCGVTRAMCAVCQEQSRGRTFDDHPVFPSLIYHQAVQQLGSTTDPIVQQHWESWLARAESALLLQTRSSGKAAPVPLCDVILCADRDSPALRSAIESVLDQFEAVPILHLIDAGRDPIDWGNLASQWNVQIHRLAGPLTALSSVPHIASSLRTPYIAIQSASATSEPQRLALSIQALRETGAELFVARLPEEAEELAPSETSPQTEIPALIPWSLVIRRAALVDLGGPEPGRLETESDFITEAFRQGRSVVIRADSAAPPSGSPLPPGEGLGVRAESPNDVRTSDQASAEIPDSQQLLRGLTRAVAPSPLQLGTTRRLRFPPVPTRCDVVLPFRGQLPYVEEALESILRQEQATPIIHLIDDATLDDTTEFLNHWAQHPQLRVYRNRENIGQFQSFNNVAPYWETDLVAVQDADDISLPHRLHWAHQMLHWSGADYFGGAVELFGDDELIRPVMSETADLVRMKRAAYRRSFYPRWAKADYFLENPTAVFRTAMFREMGGYADFGSRLMNRTSLDTEFQLRCLFRGVRFAITCEVVTRYRVHPESATQDRQTGWGTSPRAESIRQVEARCRLFRQGDFDPRSFGALGRYTHLTERWTGR